MLEQPIREDLLHYVWRMRRIDLSDLLTTSGQPIEILNYGVYNHDAGPDFLEGQVRIGDTLWVGQIEMHVRASDWYRHGHETDTRYDNVILHVVYDPDQDVTLSDGKAIPCLDLSSRIDPYVRKHYSQLIQSEAWIPCAPLADKIDTFRWTMWLESLVAQRLETKTAYLRETLEQHRGDWEMVMYIMLSRYLGGRVNRAAMETLAASVPLLTLQKNKHDLAAIEALLYGQAGMLDADHGDAYSRDLRQRYDHLRHKYGIRSMEPIQWRYSRMRPTAFPTIRIAQLATLLSQTPHLHSAVREATDIAALRELLSVTASTYWDDHYRLGKVSEHIAPKALGQSTIDSLLINAVVPCLFLYGRMHDDYALCDRAIRLLTELPAEQNKITRGYAEIGITAEHAGMSQALIHLRESYCLPRRCMSCAIGHRIMKGG